MVNMNKLMSGLGSSGIFQGFLGGAAAGAVTSGLMSKSGRKSAKTLLKVGGIAAVGTLAWKAYQNYKASQSGNNQLNDPNVVQENNQSVSLNNNPQQLSNNTQQVNNADRWDRLEAQNFDNLGNLSANQSQTLYVVKTMVAAAMADGHIDAKEYQRILNKADELGLTGDEKAVVFDEIKNPMSIEIIILNSSSPELAMEVYTASLLAIDETRSEGKRYLSKLAHGLQLPNALVEALHSQVYMEQNREL